jgi:hypothetical protein
MTRNNADFHGGETFGIAPMGRGRSLHLVTGDTSTKCTKLGDVHEPTKYSHPGGKLTRDKAAAVVGPGLDNQLCPRCFPKK